MLDFVSDFRRDEHQGLWLVNKGAGPAIVKSVEVWVSVKGWIDDKTFPDPVWIPAPPSGGKVREALKLMEVDVRTLNTGTLLERTVLQPGKKIALARMREKGEFGEKTWKLRRALGHLEIRIKYQSVYEEELFEYKLGNVPELPEHADELDREHHMKPLEIGDCGAQTSGG